MSSRSSALRFGRTVCVVGAILGAANGCKSSTKSMGVTDAGGQSPQLVATASSKAMGTTASAPLASRNDVLMAADLELATNAVYASVVASKADGTSAQAHFFTQVSTSVGVLADERADDALAKIWADDELKRKVIPPGKEHDETLAVFACLSHAAVAGALPSKLEEALDRYTLSHEAKPRLGLWNPKEAGPSLDVTALAAFRHPEDARWLRELLKSHGRTGSGYRWELERSWRKKPWAYLGSEEAALQKLKRLHGSLDESEEKRLDALLHSKLGEQDAVDAERKDLVDTYLANELRGDEKYKGKTVRIVSEVSDIKKSPLGHPYLIFGGTLGLRGSVHCQLNEAFTSEAATLNPHETVEVRGKVLGLVLGNVVLEACEL